jgi:hypothetical protein
MFRYTFFTLLLDGLWLAAFKHGEVEDYAAVSSQRQHGSLKLCLCILKADKQKCVVMTSSIFTLNLP